MKWALIFLLTAFAPHAETGSKLCATCHREIFDSYQATGMARSSGKVTDIEKEGRFTHAPSGAQYRVYRQDGAARFSFEFFGLSGSRVLNYFIGSGTVGRSYLYDSGGLLYEAPVSWYSATAQWDLSPGYRQYDLPYLTRGVDPVCLRCHASGLQPVPGTSNGYRTPPFAEGGVSCERCHGPGDLHVAGHGKMLNPAQLAADRRDSICAQCHLSGEARVFRAGAETRFRPGDRLSDSLVAFEWAGNPDMNVTSHFEKLAQSACKRSGGDRLWCGTCHDPHRETADAEKAAIYRAKCLGCHQASDCTRGPDCAGCHMPKKAVRDVQHSTYTDHFIRKPGARETAAGDRRLVPYGRTQAGDREFGLAYATLPGFEKRAIQYLERAPKDDAEVLAHLAYLYESGGDPLKAQPLYEKAVKLDPSQVAAAVNLGNIYIKDGRAADAIRQWRQALARSPGLESARMSLAVALYRSGSPAAAEESLLQLLELNPVNMAARRQLDEVRSRR